MSQPSTRSRRSGKKLRHAAKLARRRQGAFATIHPPSLGAQTMDPLENKAAETTQEVTSAEAISEEVHEALPVDEELVEGEVIEGEEIIEEGNTATPLPVMAEPGTSEAPVQAAPVEPATEIKEPAENNG